jgi:hypothetical protein
MIHLMTRADLFPCFLFVARCGYRSDNAKQFGKVKGWIATTLDGVTCPVCLKGVHHVSIR